MRYLILGSEGQVGRPLTEFLEANGHKVFRLDIVNSDNEDLRIYNNKLLDTYVQQCDFVFFLACDVGGSKYLKKYEHTFDFIQNNIKIMAHSFEIIRQYNKPVIFSSSAMSTMQHSTYGLLKQLGEKYTQTLNGIVVKFWNTYGLEHDLNKSHAITDFIVQAKNTGTIQMLTTGQESRQFLHVNDCVRCLKILSEQYNQLPRNQEYHITSFKWHTILDVANIIKTLISGTDVCVGSGTDEVQLGILIQPSPFVLNYWQPEISIQTGIKDIIDRVTVQGLHG